MASPQEKKSILVVDDTPENLTVLRRMLTDAGYRVRPALGGQIALKAISADLPDLILLDVLMPDIDGFEICKILKSQEHTRNIPVIFISALSNMEDVLTAFKAGGVDYVSKPFNSEEVLARVRTHLDLQDAIREKNVAHTMLQTIFSSIENTIVTVDDQLQIMDSNRALESICGCFPDISFHDFLHRKNCPCAVGLTQTLSNNKDIKEYRVTCSSGDKNEKTLVLNTALLKRPNNKANGAILIIRDITRRASVEKTLLEKNSYHNIVGKSEPMEKLYSLLERVVENDFNVLVTGDSGTGKELVAEAIHCKGKRAEGPLIKVNCAALSESLLESELFGHVKGAFTGAINDRVGRCQAADGGTLFLDEIGDISPQFQAKLLRFLEQKEFEKIGDSKTIKVDVRVIAATNHDLSEKVSEKQFRDDLFYRLNGFSLHLPPLKDRLEDIPLLTSHFIRASTSTSKKNIGGMSDTVIRLFMEYPWPGNIRELKSAIDYACAICPGEIIQKDDLPHHLFSVTALEKLGRRTTDSIGKAMTELLPGDEKEVIVAMLKQTGWNKAKAARHLGISRATLYTKLLKYNIH
jgi:two-component system response regulator HydG